MQTKDDILKQIRSRILMINENIRGNINSLSLDGNFDDETVHAYKEFKDKAIELSYGADSLRVVVKKLDEDIAAEISQMAKSINLKVKKADVCSELSIETDGIYFTTKLFLCDTTNFKVTEDSCYMKGVIYATSGNIGGWEISGNSLVGTEDQYGNPAQIDGGKIEALSAEGKLFQFESLDFNPEYENDYHNIDLSNATVSTAWGDEVDSATSFGTLTVHGPVEVTATFYCGELYCTSLTCRGTSGYGTIYCDEIWTNDESFSDRRLKRDIRYMDIDEGMNIMKLRPVSFKYKKGNRPSTGFIAQEVLQELSQYEIVEEQEGYYGISERQLIPLMILQIQQNYKKLKELRDGREKRYDADRQSRSIGSKTGT